MEESVWKKNPPFCECIVSIFRDQIFLFMYRGGGGGHVGDFFQRLYTQALFLPYWFLYEYLGILLVLPFLRKLAQNLTEQEAGILFILVVGWNVLNDISYACLGVGFAINLYFQDSISFFILGYLMENCPILRQSGKCGLRLGIGQVVFAISVLYWWSSRQHGVEGLGSLVMLLAIAVYYLNRYMGDKGIWNNTALQYFMLWCGSNVFGIYLIEDYLRNLTAFIWEWSAPYISAVPACCVWFLVVFLLGNVLVSGMRRLPVLKNLL